MTKREKMTVVARVSAFEQHGFGHINLSFSEYATYEDGSRSYCAGRDLYRIKVSTQYSIDADHMYGIEVMHDSVSTNMRDMEKDIKIMRKLDKVITKVETDDYRNRENIIVMFEALCKFMKVESYELSKRSRWEDATAAEFWEYVTVNDKSMKACDTHMYDAVSRN